MSTFLPNALLLIHYQPSHSYDPFGHFETLVDQEDPINHISTQPDVKRAIDILDDQWL